VFRLAARPNGGARVYGGAPLTIINSTPHRLDMAAWTYLGAKNSQFTQVNQSPGEIILRSNFDPYALVGVPQHHTYIMALRLRGTGFSDFDANGVPRSGTVTGATLENNGGFVLYFERLSMPVAQFMAALTSSDPADLRRAFLGGDDEIRAGPYDVLIGPGLGDVLFGEAGNDTIYGEGGHDTIDGGSGDDVIYLPAGSSQQPLSRDSISIVRGGDGADTVSYEFALVAVDIDLAQGVAGRDTLSGVEHARGTAFNDRIAGDGGDNALLGNAGADTIMGGGGNDFINGDTGVDRVSGDAGDDTILLLGDHEAVDGGAGVDAVNYGGAAQTVVINLATGVGTDTLSGVEIATGSFRPGDHITGSAGADSLFGGGDGPDTVLGGAGSDFIGGTGYLRGDEGNDQIQGGGRFDDINGNMGDDIAYGHGGDDWVVGGKDNDTLYGGAGADIVYGNLGADICNGEDGADTIRGGQADDVLDGGAGDDWLSGDRGSDVIRGGAGADVFHTFSEADVDVVLDFSVAEGDRVLLDPGTAYTLDQVGADTVIRMGASQLVLANVSLASLPAGWIFGA
jgi:Ca2+-binding RTX toxin-like protein